MINICLAKFLNDPWSEIVMKAFFKALSTWDKVCVVEKIDGYPKKNTIDLFLIKKND